MKSLSKGKTIIFLLSGFIVMTAVLLMLMPVSAEMKITSNDGRTISVPLNSKDVKSIVFTDDDSSQSRMPSGRTRHMGCYKDDGNRDLPVQVAAGGKLSTAQCISLCRDKGFSMQEHNMAPNVFAEILTVNMEKPIIAT